MSRLDWRRNAKARKTFQQDLDQRVEYQIVGERERFEQDRKGFKSSTPTTNTSLTCRRDECFGCLIPGNEVLALLCCCQTRSETYQPCVRHSFAIHMNAVAGSRHNDKLVRVLDLLQVTNGTNDHEMQHCSVCMKDCNPEGNKRASSSSL